MNRRVWLLLILLMVFALPALLRAEEYPARPITLINPLPPGGTLDLQGRAFAAVVEKYLGKPMVVVNKIGAAGAVGSLTVAQAKPDGYTLGLGWSAQTALIINEILEGRKPSFTTDDFIILGRFTDSSPVFLVPTNSPWKTIQQALEDIKAHPNTYSYSSGGIQSISHLPMEALITEMGLKLRHVPFQGGGPAFTALIGGHVQCSAQYPGTSLPKVKAKQLRVLASFSEKRLKNYEDVPTFKELGYNVFHSSWVGLVAPKGTPAPIVERLRTLVKQATADPAFVDVIEKAGDEVDYADAETTRNAWGKEYERLQKLLSRMEKAKKQ
ncbi:MAG: tripartite tricarboxylate transporter substrate binding protein [Syntrophales bacterium]